MAPERLQAPSKAVMLHGQDPRTPTREFAEIYPRMRGCIANVYPDASDAWKFETEFEGPQRTVPPPLRAEEWLRTCYAGSDPFCQRLAQRYVTLWEALEREGFRANGKNWYPHQQALTAWLTLGGLCAGTRKNLENALPAILIRSPYGTGKSLVGGFAVAGFQDYLLEEICSGRKDRSSLPRGAILGLRKEILLQNALGQQYSALRPPYIVDQAHAREFHRQLEQLYGERFTNYFPRPVGSKDPWYALFPGEDDEEGEDASTKIGHRISAYLRGNGRDRTKEFDGAKGSREILSLLQRIISGTSVLLPDVHQIPRERPAPRRMVESAGGGFRGDLAYALKSELGVRATHRHLLAEPERYSNTVDPAHPSLFCIATGTALTRPLGAIRADIREDILKHLAFLLVDEVGAVSPASLTDTARQASHRVPVVIGLTAQDKKIKGWLRSPSLGPADPIRLGLSKTVAFQMIGSDTDCYPEGSEGAWKQYEKALFAPVQAAQTLKLPQPYETDGLIIVPPRLVREYGHRIDRVYGKRGIPAEIYCYDAKDGPDRWKLIEDTLRAGTGVAERGRRHVPRKIVTAATPLSTGISMQLDSIDVLAVVRPIEMHQLLGRLYHRRNVDGTRESRTYYRQQVFPETKEVLLRTVAHEMEYDFPDVGAQWIPLQCAIDAVAKVADEGRKGIGKPQSVPDAPANIRRKQMTKVADDLLKPMKITSPFWQEMLKQSAERRANRARRAPVSCAPFTPTARSTRTCTAERTFGKSTLRATLSIEDSGMVSECAIEGLVKKYGIDSYYASVVWEVQNAYNNGLREEKLVEAALNSVYRLQGVQLRRNNGGTSTD